jgi:hypothetical protein
VTLIVIHCNDFDRYIEGNIQNSYSLIGFGGNFVPFLVMTGYINVMLVLQSCTDPLHILLGLSSETNATSSDCAYHIGNVKVEEDLDMQEEEKVVDEEEVNVKTEKGIGCEEEEGIDIKDEEDICSEEEEEDVDIKQEVSVEDTV